MMEAMSGYDYVMENSSELKKYAGEWIIVYDGKVVFSDKEFNIAYEKFERAYPNKTPFVMKIVNEHDMWL